MFTFSKEQRIVDINGIRFGGQPGETPTVLLGTVMYGKKYNDLTVERLSEVEGFIQKQKEMSDMTGNPNIIDVFINKKVNVEKRLSPVLDIIENKDVISIDIPESDVRVEALKYLHDSGELKRVIYNSINLGITEEEREALKTYTPEAAVVLGYNPKDMSADGRINMITSGGGMLDKGLMDIAIESGIDKVLVDTGATPFDHSAAETIRAIPVAKNEFGLPVGCAIHNLVESWLWMKKYAKNHKTEYLISDVASNGFVTLYGGDYVFYGPIRMSPYIFPYIGMTDKIVAEGTWDYFGIKTPPEHPRWKLP